MFGYVKPCQPELRVKELTAYKAVYCGLCGQLGHSFGLLARMTLSYDFAFYSMLWWAVHDERPTVEKKRCPFNPLKKRPMCTGGEALEVGADAAAILLYYKLLDNIRDGGVLHKLGYSLLRPFAASARKKAAARRPQHDAVIAQAMQRQTGIEQAGTASIDAACEPTATMLAGMFRLLSGDEMTARVLERLGYFLGRYIYLCDALDDLESDARTGNYNPLLLCCGGDTERAMKRAKTSLNLTTAEAEKILALLPMRDFAPIIENIVTMGLQSTVREILARKVKKTDDRSI